MVSDKVTKVSFLCLDTQKIMRNMMSPLSVVNDIFWMYFAIRILKIDKVIERIYHVIICIDINQITFLFLNKSTRKKKCVKIYSHNLGRVREADKSTHSNNLIIHSNPIHHFTSRIAYVITSNASQKNFWLHSLNSCIKTKFFKFMKSIKISYNIFFQSNVLNDFL